VTTYRIDFAYDGTRFHGYAKQSAVRTVQGDLETALFHLTGVVATAVAGRTDKGVHARAQVVSFDAADDLDTALVMRSLNRQLAPEIGVASVVAAPAGFDARFSATSRAYKYFLLNRAAPDPFVARTSYHFSVPLDVDRMNAGVAHLVGQHDFASFCRRSKTRSSERRLDRVEWSRGEDGMLVCDVAASSFCHQMVRSLVAMSIEVGRGRVEPDAVASILEARDRRVAKGAAPARGLTLVAVGYD